MRRYRIEYEMHDGRRPDFLDYVESASISEAEQHAKGLYKSRGAVGYMIFDGESLVEQWSERRNA